MQFNLKLQSLRKKSGLTQEELASRLFVSRTAVAKWEQGRGYPSIDSLKDIASFFSVSLDELLGTSEAIAFAEQNQIKTKSRFTSLFFALLDICALLFLFLPLFAQKQDSEIVAVSLISLSVPSSFIIAVCYIAVCGQIIVGITSLFLTLYGVNCSKITNTISVFASIFSATLFALCRFPYASIFAISLLVIKVVFLIKRS